MPKQILHITGMHCKSCVFLVKDTITNIDGIDGVQVDLHTQTVQYLSAHTDHDIKQLIDAVNPLLQEHGYTLHIDKPQVKINR